MQEGHTGSWPSGLPEPQLPLVRLERRDAAAHRRRILEVARRLFTQQGIDAVSMHQIALAAGIGQGTLYRRYANKGELCMDLMQERHEQFVSEIATLFAETAPAPVLVRLEGVLARVVALLEEQSALLGPVAALEMREVCCSAPDHIRSPSLLRAPFYLWLHELLSGLLEEAVERAELAPLDILYTADALFATLNPLVYRFQRQERGFSPERILQGLRHIYITGVKASES